MRRLADLAIVAAAMLLTGFLSGCEDTATTRPFRPAPGAGRELTLPPDSSLPGAATESAEFVVAAPAGAPPATSAKIATALVVALRSHGIAASTAPAAGSRNITATVQVTDVSPQVTLDIGWSVAAAAKDGAVSYRQRTVADSQAWQNGDDRVISRIAAQAAFHISRQLGRGDPNHVPLAALADVLGPGAWPAAPNVPEPEPAAPGAPPLSAPPGPPGSPPPPAASPQPPLASASTAPRVRVAAVTGVSGEAGRAMAVAMRRALGESMMVLIERPEAGAYLVEGSVELSPPAEGRQRVVIRWVVKRGDGTQIGDLEQANTVRAGSLEGNWDKLAPVVAEAAVDAVVELITLDRSRSGR